MRAHFCKYYGRVLKGMQLGCWCRCSFVVLVTVRAHFCNRRQDARGHAIAVLVGLVTERIFWEIDGRVYGACSLGR